MGKVPAQFVRLKVAIVASVAISALVGTCVYAASVPALYTGQQATDGEVVFTRNCASCHGDALQGGSVQGSSGRILLLLPAIIRLARYSPSCPRRCRMGMAAA
jgi:hypothetical protein